MDRNLIFVGVFLIFGIVAVSGCTSSQTSIVTIQNSSFNPSTLNVQVGTTVTWINKDTTTHDVVSDTGLFNSGNLTNGMSYNYTFNQTGSFAYHSAIQPSMTGTIVVSTNSPSSNGSSNSTSGGSGIKY
ncbi:cupredoxin domain-containing protein [Methanobacterium spitsbergense]|uniref:Cupredoxin domain-containing protein n=1 Tax=Methanobacterium spitsbergense TaxID=2874285 RepID=A0A8T5UUX8_9EURY|nr:cupredoxin domain-containing protein [Methanobacterium spitsbergense]MBZ2164459.1 cupredoxin domain-containing protein [Methanobacterium spitsbergense]